MARIESSVLVRAPLHEVFAYASDWRRWAEWFEGVSDFRPVTEIARGNGARYAYRARVACFRVEVVTEIAEFAENVGWKGVSRRGMPHTTHWRFEAVGDQTRFTYVVEGRVPVPGLSRLIDGLLLEPQWRRIVEGSLANLKRRFESMRENPPPATDEGP
jgi:hypothetical protein